MSSIPVVRCYPEKKTSTYFYGHFHTNLFQNFITSIVCESEIASEIVGTS